MQTRKIKIRKPYYGAGSSKQYNWVKDGFHIFGIGVKVDYLDDYDILEITVDKKNHCCKNKRYKKFC